MNGKIRRGRSKLSLSRTYPLLVQAVVSGHLHAYGCGIEFGALIASLDFIVSTVALAAHQALHSDTFWTMQQKWKRFNCCRLK